ncbi:MAG: GNAT family N-acetyltransferase [Candidatus Aminicenantes bacterium]|nr:GNAT family N-acetyltransferase [Candidatus Aminicenantes bacterium]
MEDLLDKVKGQKYQIRVLNFKYRDFQQNDTVTMRIDVNKTDIEELFSAVLSKRNKRYIRQLDTEEALIRKGDSSDLIADFYDIFSDVMHRHGTPVFSRRLFFILPRTLAATYYVVYKKGVPVSAAVVIDDEKISWIPWSGTHSQYMDSRPGLIMYWETIKDAFFKEKLIYDFGRSSYGSGPYVYKSRWGAVPVKIDILQPKVSNVYRKYSDASSVWKKIPSGVARWLGPKICKYLSDL